ncbi:DAK2 domain-containing protein [Streptomyces triticagri]|uniref:DAK2 domain-containing protein n=1 Tax=Streptomyces triticagri TaxID=2293568 RepID=A0A372MDF8_9ACTN|nr:DAK2 domain-containing protein [Streptomyces triticagri]RFU88535.1 DAK2 domain-containing protein [Streptomyces triticagri]
MPGDLGARTVRAWCGLALEALGRAREEIDAINVYPVADSDTGTNLYLTVESASRAVEAVFAAYEVEGGTSYEVEGGEVPGGGRDLQDTCGPSEGADGQASAVPSRAEVMRAMAHGALIGARGNSGTILAQLLRGMSEVLAVEAPDGTQAPQVAPGELLAAALTRAAESAYEAVAHPVEGTVLTVATAAARAARQHASAGAADVARGAYDGAREALRATPGQLPVLKLAGVVDAGGRGLVAVLGALAEAVSGHAVSGTTRRRTQRGQAGAAEPAGDAPAAPEPEDELHAREEREIELHARVEECPPPDASAASASGVSGTADAGPAFEVIYLLEAQDAAVARLRGRLDALGDSLVVVGGDGLWNVHVHVDDAGAAVEAGVEAGRPYRIRITHFGAGDAHSAGAGAPVRERAARAVVAVVPGEGLVALYAEAGATTVLARPGEPPASGELVDAVRRAHAREVVLLPNDAELRHTAAAAAEEARTEGVRVALIPTRSAVQGLAALAVHEPERRFDEDVVAMTSAAGATRYAELAVAERQSWTTAGICQAGDVLGLIDGDVAVIGQDLAQTAGSVLDRMLAAGGELVTLVLGPDVPQSVADGLEARVRTSYLAVDTVVYGGGRHAAPLLIGVE